MRAALKWLGRGALALLVVAVAAVAGGYLWLRGSLPTIDGERAAYGLAAPVEVVRDRNGIPHVLARNEEDALFALGHVHAQDRLWQMEMNRRIGAGRLAEVLGPPALGTDRLLRVLGLHHRAKATLAHLEPGARRRIAAYVNGVNSWLETREGPLPPEFLILGFSPEPWTAADTVVWAKVMALDLGREWTRDLMRLRMSEFLAPDRILDFYTPYRPDKPRGVVFPEPSSHAPTSGRSPPGADSNPAPDRRPPLPGHSTRTTGRPADGASGSFPEHAFPGGQAAAHFASLASDKSPARPTRPSSATDEDPLAAAEHPRAYRFDVAAAACCAPQSLLRLQARPPPSLGPCDPPPQRLPLGGFASLATRTCERAATGFALRPRSGYPGSNSWIVAGARSATGKPILANDPHLGLTVPSVWYFVHLSWPGRDIVGATFPGMPVVVLGHNGQVAWGFTNTGADTQDLFIEKLDPENPARYLTPAGYRRFDVRREVIKVKDGEDLVVRVRETRHGPVLDDASAAAADASPPGQVLALGWAALRDDDLTLQAGLGFPEARDWMGFIANLRNFHSPPQNVSYADIDGNIGFLVPGRIPVRSGIGPGGVGPGTMPRPGWSADHDWAGFIPFDALPRVYNPASEAIVTANHSVTTEDYPHHLSFEWAAGFRAERIMERLAARPRHDVESFRALQQDRVSLFARAMLPRLRSVALGPDAGTLSQRARGLLDGWSGEMEPELPQPLIFNAWIWEFARLVTADELGSVQQAAWGRKGTFIQRILEASEIWCDDLATERNETCDEMLARAMVRAMERIAERQGDDPTAWRWGQEHFALAEHRPLANSPLARIFNLRGPAPGGIYTVNAFEFSPLDTERPFTSTHGPSLRAIYDLADLDRSLFIHSTGQSGNVLSPLYDSFEERWRNGEYVTIPTRREAFGEGALGRLRLNPR